MAKHTPIIFTNFSQGEISEEIEARVDVAKRQNGARTIENFWLIPEGGGFRRPGLKYLGEVKFSGNFTRLIPFQYSTADAYLLEFGVGYIRFIKNRVHVLSAGLPYEIASPYALLDLRDLHFEQSSDFMFITSLNPNLDVQKLIRLADDDWVLSNFNADPPPSVEFDENPGIAGTLSAVSGSGTLTVGSNYFLAGDIGRQVISGTGKATITTVAPPLTVGMSVLDSFADTTLEAGTWFLRGAPQTTLDVNIKEPVGAEISLVAGIDAFRPSYVDQFIKLYGGVIQLTTYIDPLNMTGVIKAVLSEATTADPAAAPAGSWRLQEAAWSDARGRPRTLTIDGGRLVFFSTPSQADTFWGSDIDDIFNFAVGTLATNAYQYTLQTGQQNPIQWAASLGSLYIGDTLREYAARGQGVDKPISAEETPFVRQIDQVGGAHVQPLIVDNAILLIQRFGHDVVQLSYSLNDSPDAGAFVSTDLTLFARHLQEIGFSIYRPAYAKKPYSIAYFCMNDGQLAGLTFKPRQEVSAWARTKLRGTDAIDSVAVVPHENGQKLTVAVISRHTISGLEKRYIEYFEDDDPNLQTRTTDGVRWSQCQTDSNKTGTILAGASTIPNLGHLALETVDVILGDDYIGQKTVSVGGVVTLDAPVAENTCYEVGLHFDSTLETVRPNIPGEVTEGLKRSWPIVFVRVKNTIGGTINGKTLKRQPDGQRMFSGLCKAENLETADPYDGSLRIEQRVPYPFTCLGVSGKIAFGEDMV